MFKLIVDNKEIYIRKNTSVQLEVNNSIFSTEKTEGEVIFTFDIPAEINDVIVRDFVPALDSNNVACLYDRVSQTFFYNAGTGTFGYE